MAVLVHVYDFRSNRVGEYRLQDKLTVGKDDNCDIVLPSPFISSLHAELLLVDAEVSVRAIGMNGVFINDLGIPAGEQRIIRPKESASVPGYMFYFSGLVDVEKVSDIELERQYVTLKRGIHEELLQLAELDERAIVAGNDQSTEKLRWHLNALLDGLNDVSDLLIAYIVKKEIQGRVVNAVMRGSIGENQERAMFFRMNPDQLAFDRFIATCLNGLGIDKDPGKAQIATVRENFGPVFDSNKKALAKHQLLFIAKESIRADIDSLVFGLGPLEDLLHLPDITEIMVVSRSRIFIEKGGGLEETGRSFPSEDDLNVAVNRMVRPIGRSVNKSEPIVDARLGDGSRVHIVIPPVAIRGASVTIRRFRDEPFTIDDLIRFGTFGPRVAAFLRGCILTRKNIVISGGTGSGKTTLLNVLGGQIPDDQRLVVIEDSAELQLRQPNLVNLEARKANLEGRGEISIKDLVRASLRMRPDRIVVGECRGGEALDMLQAMNTGHDGSMTTGHANSPLEMVQRLQVMVMEAGGAMPIAAIRQQIASAVDLIIQIQRQRDRVRRITHVSEVVGYDYDRDEVIIEDIFSMANREGFPELRFTGYLPTFIDQMLRQGDILLEDLFG